MNFDEQFADEQVRHLYELINQHKEVLVTGIEGLHVLKRVIAYAVQKAGVTIEWEPDTPATLRERVAISSLSALQWSIPFTAVGFLFGKLLGRPLLGAALGAGGGAVAGALQGNYAVSSGWRLRGYTDEHGVEYVEVKVRALPAG